MTFKHVIYIQYKDRIDASKISSYTGMGEFAEMELRKMLSINNKVKFDIPIKGESLANLLDILKKEIERLLIEKDKGTLIGQYPSHVIRNIEEEILGKKHIINVRNQWHDYISHLDGLYIRLSDVFEADGEVTFLTKKPRN